MRYQSMILAILALAHGTLQVRAADWYTGAEPQRATDDWIVSVNTSVDITSQNSRFGDLNGTMAPVGTLNTTGPRVRIDALGGVYSYQNSAGATVNGSQESGAVLVGYEWDNTDLSVAAYLGGDARHNSLSIVDPANPVVGTSFGLKGSLELYAKPSAMTIVSGYASYETNKSAYFTRLRAGYLVGRDVYIGPEVAALGDAFFNQERIGGHLSGFKLGGLQLALAGGYLYDRVRKNGAYVSLDARAGF